MTSKRRTLTASAVALAFALTGCASDSAAGGDAGGVVGEPAGGSAAPAPEAPPAARGSVVLSAPGLRPSGVDPGTGALIMKDESFDAEASTSLTLLHPSGSLTPVDLSALDVEAATVSDNEVHVLGRYSASDLAEAEYGWYLVDPATGDVVRPLPDKPLPDEEEDDAPPVSAPPSKPTMTSANGTLTYSDADGNTWTVPGDVATVQAWGLGKIAVEGGNRDATLIFDQVTGEQLVRIDHGRLGASDLNCNAELFVAADRLAMVCGAWEDSVTKVVAV